MVLATIERDNPIYDLYYSNGYIYYNSDDKIWGINLSEGNGNYNIKEYDFDGYVDQSDWFYIANNKIYYFAGYGLTECELTMKECELQTLDIRQASDIKIDGKTINVEFDNVYVEDEKFIYILSEDKENIYKIDINNPTYDDGLLMASYIKVDKIGPNAHLLNEKSKLSIDEIQFSYENKVSPTFFVNYKKQRYDLKNNDYFPITLLPNNYLKVDYFYDKESYSTEEKYINLKTGSIDEDYSLGNWNDIYFITKQ